MLRKCKNIFIFLHLKLYIVFLIFSSLISCFYFFIYSFIFCSFTSFWSCCKHSCDNNSLAGEGTTAPVPTSAELCEDRSLLSPTFPIEAACSIFSAQCKLIAFYDFYYILFVKEMPIICRILGIKEKFKGKH